MPNPSSPISPHHPGNPMRRHSLPVILVVFALLAFLWSCDQPAGPGEVDAKPMFNCMLVAYDSLYDVAALKKIYKPNIISLANVQSSPIAENLEVRLNGKDPDSSAIRLASDCLFLQKTGFYKFFMPYTDNIHCNITSPIGTVNGMVAFPDPTVIASPKNNDSIYVDQPLTISWTGNATFYYLFFQFVDSNYYFSIIDTVLGSNSIEIVPEKMTNLKGLDRMAIGIQGFNGPELSSRTEANMQGDGPGYLYAMNATKFSIMQDIYLTFIGSKIIGRNYSQDTISAGKINRMLAKIINIPSELNK